MKNNINRKYFAVLFKKNISILIFNTMIFTLFYIIPLVIKNSNPDYNPGGYYSLSTNYGFLIAILAIFAIFYPAVAFEYLNRKKQIDSYYSLPITRNSIAVLHIIFGLLSVIVPFTVVYFTGSIITLIKFKEITYYYYIIFYFLITFSFILYFLFNTFFFTRANKISDGIITMMLANFVFATVAWAIRCLFFPANDTSMLIVSSFIPFSGFIFYGNYFNDLIVAKYNYYDYCIDKANIDRVPLSYNEWMGYNIDEFKWIYLIILLCMAAISIALFFVLHKKRKPENAEDISNSKFGLRVIVPIIHICMGIVLAINTEIISGLILYCILIASYIGFNIYELRSFKMPLYKIIILIVIISLMFIF